MLRIISAQVKSAQFFDDALGRAERAHHNVDFDTSQRGNPQYRLVGETEQGETIDLGGDTVNESDIDMERSQLKGSFQTFHDEFGVVQLKFVDVERVYPDIPVPEYDRWVQEQEMHENPTPPAQMPMRMPFPR